MKYTGVSLRLFAIAVFVAGMSTWIFSAYAQEAMDQLENAANTGTLFDGSDGDRFGTDTNIGDSGSVPDVPPPTEVETPTDNDNSQDSSDDSGSADSSRSDDSESDTAEKTGTERAE